jgi:homoaconitase/3-isopropylmalate dehydratase large subunit
MRKSHAYPGSRAVASSTDVPRAIDKSQCSLNQERKEVIRSALDLIVELEEEAKSHWHVSMVAGFEDSTIFIHANDENRLALLNSAIEVGGVPVGLIAVDQSESDPVLRVRAYFEHQELEEFDAEPYLLAPTDHIRQSLLSRG